MYLGLIAEILIGNAHFVTQLSDMWPCNGTALLRPQSFLYVQTVKFLRIMSRPNLAFVHYNCKLEMRHCCQGLCWRMESGCQGNHFLAFMRSDQRWKSVFFFIFFRVDPVTFSFCDKASFVSAWLACQNWNCVSCRHLCINKCDLYTPCSRVTWTVQECSGYHVSCSHLWYIHICMCATWHTCNPGLLGKHSITLLTPVHRCIHQGKHICPGTYSLLSVP